MRPRSLAAGVAAAVSLLVACGRDASEPITAPDERVLHRQRVAREGVSIDLEITATGGDARAPRAGDDVRIRFAIADAASGRPIGGLAPAAWIDPRAPGVLAASADPVKKVEAYLGGGLLSRAAVDLNAWFVLTLDEGPSVSVIDPLFDFGGFRLLARVPLASPGADWALSRDESRLFVALPEAGRVAAIDTAAWRPIAEVMVAGGPDRLALQGDGRYLWVAGADRLAALAVDAEAPRLVAELPLPRGRHEIAIVGGDRMVAVSTAPPDGPGSITLIDVARLEVAGELAAGSAPTAIAYAPLADRLYVADAAGGILAIDWRRRRIAARIETEPGIGPLRLAPGGRLGFCLDPGRDRVHVFDTASDRLLHSAATERHPDQLAFSDELAYVHHAGSERVLMIPLAVAEFEAATLPLIELSVGMRAPSAGGALGRAGSLLAQAPGSGAMVIANPVDRAVFFYKEGMAAPMGSFATRSERPRAILVLDRSLQERRRSGVYETVVRLPRAAAGDYDLTFLLDAPRIVESFALAVAADPAQARTEAARHRVEIGGPQWRRLEAGIEQSFELALRQSAGGAPLVGLDDLRALVYLTPGIWQRRLRPAETAPGVYRFALTPPRSGHYSLHLQSAVAGLSFGDPPAATLIASETP